MNLQQHLRFQEMSLSSCTPELPTLSPRIQASHSYISRGSSPLGTQPRPTVTDITMSSTAVAWPGMENDLEDNAGVVVCMWSEQRVHHHLGARQAPSMQVRSDQAHSLQRGLHLHRRPPRAHLMEEISHA